MTGPSIKPLCTTRWTVRTKAIEAVLKNYAVLEDTMKEVNETQHDDNGALAGGVLARMEKFETYWGLKLAHLVFSAAEELSRSLQGKDTSAQEAHLACRSVGEYYRKLRDDELEFEHLVYTVKLLKGQQNLILSHKFQDIAKDQDDTMMVQSLIGSKNQERCTGRNILKFWN